MDTMEIPPLVAEDTILANNVGHGTTNVLLICSSMKLQQFATSLKM
jgi:hypothetical protein